MASGTERKVWIQLGAGSLDRLEIRKETLPPPQPGQARIRIRAIGLNFADVFACLGLYSATPRGDFIPGLEFSGEVEALSDTPSRKKAGFKKGDRVMGLIRFGAYATHLNADLRYLYKIPREWSFEQGAAFLAQGLTAQYAIAHLGHVRREETVLVQSAAGGVGLLSLFILKWIGARAIAVVGNPEKASMLSERMNLPSGDIIVRQKGSFAQLLHEAAPDGVDVILDAVYGKYFKAQYNALRAGGRYVLFGAADLMPSGSSVNYATLGIKYLSRPRIDPLQMISENKSLLAFNLIWLWDRIDFLRDMFEDMMKLPWKSQPPIVGRTFSFEEVPSAMRFFQSGKSVGKVVIKPASDTGRAHRVP
ncbi:MAG: zinc-binding dehydrogenase [Leptospirales bacterium]|nr:zinc-binding dehydrogenase [Leptospirales bacterium]